MIFRQFSFKKGCCNIFPISKFTYKVVKQGKICHVQRNFLFNKTIMVLVQTQGLCREAEKHYS